MKILLAGDSWGIGVFHGVDNNYSPIGQGMHTILEEKGYEVINVSVPGSNNSDIVNNIENSYYLADKIVFVQTDAFREQATFNDQKYKVLDRKFLDKLLNYNSLSDFFLDYYQRLYLRLSKIPKPVICIGGWSKLHPSISYYQNLIPAVVSATKEIILELEKDVYLSDFEWFPQLNDCPEFKDKFGKELAEVALASSRKFDLLCQHCGDCHPNLAGYRILVEKIEKFLLQDK